jgi:stage V sporulation protein D (sporulation-specific penicillin-binding protein)
MKTLPYLFIDEFFTERKNPAVINTNPSNAMRFRSKIVMTAVFSLLFAAVAGNFFKISVLDNKTYQTMANDQHFGSISISAHRGSIYDANGYAFAKSATVYKIFIDPESFREDMASLQKLIDKRNLEKANGTYTPVYDEEGNETNALPASSEEFREMAATFLASKLDVTADKVKEAMDAEGRYVEFKNKKVEKPVADEIAEFFGDMGFISVGSTEDTKRYYPQNELAAQVVGFTNGNIAYGIEAYYDSYLSGVDGRTVSAVDSNGKELPYRYSKTFEPEDGSDVYLTIDRELQFILEKHLEEMSVEHEVKNRSCAILMNPQTGAVLGMATYPSFDLNQPMELADDGMLLRKIFTEKKIDEPTEKDIEEYTPEARERQWKNKCVSERYEPGSVFKIITAASAIEEKTIDIDKFTHYCKGYELRDDGTDTPVRINCHELGGHDIETFQDALTHSCNPSFIAIGETLGIEKFHKYFDAFGFEEKTGIDLPVEMKGDIPPLVETDGRKPMSNIDLALSSFGQCETVTPIELITACSAVVNGGYLLQPYVVDKVVDSDGNIELKNERTVRRQVISEDTSAKMRTALEKVVEDNQAGNVKIKGYAIGGKSGTSQRLSEIDNTLDENKQENADIQEYGASYICFTPADHPDLMLLVLADMPLADSTGQYYGSKCAVPCAAKILEDVLEYMDKSPEYSDLELKNLDIKVPLVRGSSLDDAKKTLLGLGIMEDHIQIIGSGIEVVEQSPKTGMSISKDGYIYLYTEKGNTTDPVMVPDLTGFSPEAVNQTIYAYGLNYVSKNIVGDQEDAYVESQSIEGGLMVEKGTTIEVKFKAQQFND